MTVLPLKTAIWSFFYCFSRVLLDFVCFYVTAINTSIAVHISNASGYTSYILLCRRPYQNRTETNKVPTRSPH